MKVLKEEAQSATLEGKLIKWQLYLGLFQVSIAVAFAIYLAVEDIDWAPPVYVRSNVWGQYDVNSVLGNQTVAQEQFTQAATAMAQGDVYTWPNGTEGLSVVWNYAATCIAAQTTTGNANVCKKLPIGVLADIDVTGANNCASNNPCLVLPTETKIQDELSLSWLVFTFTLISGTAHLIQYVYSSTYITCIKEGTNYFRLGDYALSASIMFMTFSVLWYAPPSVEQLLLNFAVIFEVIVLGYGAEVLGYEGRAYPAATCFCAGSIAYMLAWSNTWVTFAYGVSGDGKIVQNALGVDLEIPLATSTVTIPPLNVNANLKWDGSSNAPPDFVYVILLVLFVTFSLFVIPAGRRLARAFKSTTLAQDSHLLIQDEFLYGFLSFFSKVTLTVIAWTGAAGRVENVILSENSEESTDTEADDQLALYAGFGGVLVLDFILAGVMWYDIRKHWTGPAVAEDSDGGLRVVAEKVRSHSLFVQPENGKKAGVSGTFPTVMSSEM